MPEYRPEYGPKMNAIGTQAGQFGMHYLDELLNKGYPYAVASEFVEHYVKGIATGVQLFRTQFDWDDVRERIARLIDPTNWWYADTQAFPKGHPAHDGITRRSLEAAEAIMALLELRREGEIDGPEASPES